MRRQWVAGGIGVLVLAAVGLFVSRLKPASPTVDRATVWTDTVKQGPLLRQVRGPGTLECGFPMPYRKTLTVKVTNRGPVPVPISSRLVTQPGAKPGPDAHSHG